MAKPIPTQIPPEVEARFWSKVDKRGPDECWPWMGSGDQRGYGQMWIAGGLRRVTRVVLQMERGTPLGRNELACHRCDNPPCCNPAHLFVGSMSDNILDAVSKGRMRLDAMWARNANRDKTHCVHGHLLSGPNLYVHPRGDRVCRACHRNSQRNWKARTALNRADNAEG